MQDYSVKSYINTLIFTIISAIGSILIMILLYMGILKNYIYFVIGLEIGIFFIIIYTIYKIMQSKSIYQVNDLNIKFDHCPDFWTLKNDKNGRPYCCNEWIIDDNYGSKKFIKIYPYIENPHANTYTLPTQIDNSPPIDGSPIKYDKFYLDTLQSANLSSGDKCNFILNEPADKTSSYSGFTPIPWTTIRSKCSKT